MWLDVQPWLPVTPPFSAGSSHRSPELLEQVVAQFRLDRPGRYTPRDVSGDGKDETFCNVFVSDATQALGCPIPHVGLRSITCKACGAVAPGWGERRVLETRAWLIYEGPRHGWEKLPDGHVAQAMADTGQVAVTLHQGATAAHGHIALLVPSRGQPGVWIAQAGRSVFPRGTLESGFGALPVEYWGHP